MAVTTSNFEQGLARSKRTTATFSLLALLLFMLLYAVTVPDITGDTSVYVNDILNYAQGGGVKAPLIWEFGHLLWRPLGYWFWQVTQPLTSIRFPGNPLLQIQAVLFAFDYLGGAALSVLAFAITRRLGLRTLPAILVSMGILLSSAVLDYVHSGTSYVPGLALHLLGIWFILKALDDERRRMVWAKLAGVALAFACDIWFLYVLALPAAWLSILVLPAENVSLRERTRVAGVAIAVTAACGLIPYAIGIALCHISSLADLRTWIQSSGHGMHANRPWVRFPTGISRTFLYLGEGGLALKQLVFRDPYAPSRWSTLVHAGVWKIALVFLTLGAVAWYARRGTLGRAASALLWAAVIPTFAFAFLFDTSSPERYLPLYLALLVAVCVVLGDGTKMRVPRWLLGIFFAALILVNLKTYALDLRASTDESSGRARLIHEHTRHNGVAMIMSFSDPLSTYFSRRPFDPQNQQNALPLYHVFDFASLGKRSWSTGVSCRALRAWQQGGEIWVSKRFLAARPQQDWGWVESDHPSVRWTDTSRFFRDLDVDTDLGGPDGFVRLAHDSKNQQTLNDNCSE